MNINRFQTSIHIQRERRIEQYFKIKNKYIDKLLEIKTILMNRIKQIKEKNTHIHNNNKEKKC